MHCSCVIRACFGHLSMLSVHLKGTSLRRMDPPTWLQPYSHPIRHAEHIASYVPALSLFLFHLRIWQYHLSTSTLCHFKEDRERLITLWQVASVMERQWELMNNDAVAVPWIWYRTLCIDAISFQGISPLQYFLFSSDSDGKHSCKLQSEGDDCFNGRSS